MMETTGLGSSFGGGASRTMGSTIATRELARRDRMLNAKQRTIGIDVMALDETVMMHKEAAAAAKADEAAYAEFQKQLLEVAAGVERELIQAMIDVNIDLRAHWRLQADKAIRREYDLNDPDALKKDKPARVGDDDPRCGPSSMQKFAGEDLDKKERDAMNAAALTQELASQLGQKAAAKAAQEEEDRLYAQFTLALLRDLQDATNAAEAESIRDRIRVANENRMLAAAKRARERAQKEADSKAEWDEVQAARNSALLTESRDLAINYADPHRVRRDHFKGMSQQQLAAIAAEQQAQRDELARRRAEEKAEDEQWGATVRAQAATAASLEHEEAQSKADAQRQYYLDLKAQQRAQRLRAKQAKADNRNVVEPYFFDKFNATSHN